MKKVLLFIMSILLMASVANAGQFVFDQGEVDSLVPSFEGLNGFEQIVIPTDNLNKTFANSSFTYDITFEALLSDKLFFTMENMQVGDVLQVTYNFNNQEISPGVLQVFTTTINITKDGNYDFLFNPSFEGERVEVWINYPNSYPVNVELFKFTRQRGIGDVSDDFVSAMLTLLEINVSIWRLLFFMLLISVVIGVFALLGYFVIEMLEWAEKFNQKKKRHLFNGEGRK